jgi:uncharacterized membrane protein
MVKIEVSVEIKQPIEKVFVAVTDLKSRSKWEPSMLEIEITSGDGWVTGAKLRGVNMVIGQQIPWIANVLEFETNKRMMLKVTSDMSAIVEHFSVDAIKDGTKLAIVYEMELFGLAKMIAPMVTGGLEKQLKENLTRLKALLEG